MTDHAPKAADLPLAERVSLLSGETFWRTRALPARGVPAVVLSDGPHGLRFQAEAGDHLGIAGSTPATCFPTAVTLASTWDDDLVADVGRAVAVEALALDVDVVLGPGINIKRHPLGGRNFEYLSEDPLLTGRLAAAMVEGIQGQGVGACVKHYAVNNQEGHRFVVDAVVEERTLREIYLAGFELAMGRQPWCVMSSYNLVNGEYAGESPHLMRRILRDEWGFEGVVMSDWGAVSDRARGVAVGLDLEMPGSGGLFDAEVLQAVADGRLDEACVTESAQRVLDLAARAPRTGGGATLPAEEHDALARRVAAEGSVLLTNDGTLPLRQDWSVALIGAFAEQPRYQGSGSSLVTPTRITTALEALRGRGTAVTYAAGYDLAVDEARPDLIEEAVRAARETDVAVVMVGLPPRYESESFDRTDLALPAAHDALVRAVAAVNPRTVVALSNGAPVLLPWKDEVAAILESYLGGQASGGGLVDVLSGDVEPGGRLAETFPARQADVAADPWFPGEPHQVDYREGLSVGYRHDGAAPLFPFGHGLGYTTMRWDDFAATQAQVVAGDDLAVEGVVTNTGDRAGSDVVQVYVRDHTGVVRRPPRELAGYAKVRLLPGESARVSIRISARAFAYFDVDADGWRTPSGAYDLEVARSSADVVATLRVRVAGDIDRAGEPADSPALATDDAVFARRLGRPVPRPRPVRPFSRQSTTGEIASTRVGALARAAMMRRLGVDQLEDEHERLMMRAMFDEMPLRAVAVFSRGALSLPTVDLLVAVLNRDVADLGRRLLMLPPAAVRRLRRR